MHVPQCETGPENDYLEAGTILSAAPRLMLRRFWRLDEMDVKAVTPPSMFFFAYCGLIGIASPLHK
jgi:hypothetical protein